MKKLIYISILFLFYGCVFAFDPGRGLIYVHNNSNEVVYVYLKYGNADSLPLISELKSFTFINANAESNYTIDGTTKKPRLPNNENEVTFFFITKKTMLSYDLKEIHKNQMFVKKKTLTKEELKNKNWIVTYP